MKKYEKVFPKDYETWYGENEAYRKQVAEDPDRDVYKRQVYRKLWT